MARYQRVKLMTQYQLRTMYRNKIAVFFSLMLPIVMLLIFGFLIGGNGKAPSRMAIGWLDADQGGAAVTIRTVADQSDLYEIITGDEEGLRAKLTKGDLAAILMLPAGLTEQVAAKGGPANVTILVDPSSQSAGRAAATLEQVVGTADRALSGELPRLVATVGEVTQAAQLDVFDYLLPGQLVNMLLCAGLITVAMGLAMTRQSGALRHLFSTPLSISLFLTTRVLANLLLALVQIALLYAVAIAVFQVNLPANLLGTALLLVVCTLTSLGIGLPIGTLAKNMDAVMPLSLITYMVLLFLGNAMMPLDGAPAIMQSISQLTPSYYMTRSLRLVMMQGAGLGEVGFDIAVMAAWAVVGLTLAAWRMRKQFVTA